MKNLLNESLRRLIIYAGLILVISIPVYYWIISLLWEYELNEHRILLTPEADREDKYLIIALVTILTVFFFALLLVGFLLLNQRFSSKLWKPFYTSLAQVQKFNLSQQQPIEFANADIAEFQELNNSLKKLTDANINTFRQQKEFTDNASHELQTPLAIIQSKLENLLQSSPLSNEQYEQIEGSLVALNRISHINRNLQWLAKIENSQFPEVETVQISEIVKKAIESLTEIGAAKEIHFAPEIEDHIILKSNKTLVDLMVTNLLTNAIRYSLAGTFITVKVSTNTLEVINLGTTPLQADKLFKRFSAVSADQPGSGLGLAIVKQIADRFGWTTGYAFDSGRHQFTVRF